ncbi:hypothetical protein HBI56_177340 [Parastagonospora nodorum]|nr:hypothetical protein HBH56_047970 [Parastagonospora nodorum]KAH3933264.1 hypothetical protein HBH54_075710 [Parastagonospora nodorum]KAH3938838.1 hypothetical protein HBH53_243880 [Parastagonospora nodorum]KAH3973044.1 hypothetical protein HBH52_147760 [Parastagonospora nodorum]KAH4003942.1 hypothetical protein HBI10_054700 [Parastagonospora nodorum]
MSGTGHVSPLFSLPLELREEIYKSVLSGPSQGLDILRTCQEIQHEAQKFLYQRELIFPSQGALYAWLAKTPRELIAYVSSITIHVQDVDLRPILGDLTSSYQSATPLRLSTSELYRAEVGSLGQALKEIPKLRIITLRALLHQPSMLYRQFTTQVLRVVSASCPHLLDLRLEGNFHHQGLEFLATLNSLESLSFDGFSLSSPVQAVKILASLSHLHNLSLVSEYAPSNPDTGLDGNLTAKGGHFKEEVLRTARRLPYVSTAEEIPVLSPTSFFISEVLSSLHDHNALNSISIRLSYTPNVATLVSLEEFLKRSPITRLELDWPDLQPDVLQRHCLLGSHLKTVWVKIHYESYAIEILWSIVENRQAGDLNNLRKVVLIRPITFCGGVRSLPHDERKGDVKTTTLGARNESHASGDQGDMNILQAKRRLQYLGINAVWYTEDPQPVRRLGSGLGNLQLKSYRAAIKTVPISGTVLANDDRDIVHLFSDGKENPLDDINS